MTKRIRSARDNKSGLFHAREARHMSRSELVRLSGVSKQQLSRLENNQIRLRLDHLRPFAKHLGFSPEQMLLWGRYPGTGEGVAEVVPLAEVPEIETRSSGAEPREKRKDGRHTDGVKPERWVFPANFVREQLHSVPAQLIVVEADGDSMVPTIAPGERVIVDTGHKSPTPDGLYAIRDALGSIVVKRVQVMRSARPPRAKIISDNPKHASDEAPLEGVEIVGKVVCCLKLI